MILIIVRDETLCLVVFQNFDAFVNGATSHNLIFDRENFGHSENISHFILKIFCQIIFVTIYTAYSINVNRDIRK